MYHSLCPCLHDRCKNVVNCNYPLQRIKKLALSRTNCFGISVCVCLLHRHRLSTPLCRHMAKYLRISCCRSEATLSKSMMELDEISCGDGTLGFSLNMKYPIPLSERAVKTFFSITYLGKHNKFEKRTSFRNETRSDGITS